MSRKYLTPIDLVQNELQNAKVQNLGTAPTTPTPVKGQIYFNSTDNTLYWFDGSVWVAAKGTGGAAVSGGAGLVLTGSVLDVGQGTGITVAPDTVSVDTTYLDGRYALVASAVKRYAVDVGGSTTQVVTHNLNTLDTHIQVYRKATPFDQIECDVEHTTVNTVTLRFATAPSAAEYRAVVIA